MTERGTFFGYGDLVVDMRTSANARGYALSRHIRRHALACNSPGKGEGGEQRRRARDYSAADFAALAAGADGLFLETHPDPAQRRATGQT